VTGTLAFVSEYLSDGIVVTVILATMGWIGRGFRRLEAKIDGIDAKLDSKIDGVDDKLDSKIESLRNEMVSRFAHVDARFDNLALRIDRLYDQRSA